METYEDDPMAAVAGGATQAQSDDEGKASGGESAANQPAAKSQPARPRQPKSSIRKGRAVGGKVPRKSLVTMKTTATKRKGTPRRFLGHPGGGIVKPHPKLKPGTKAAREMSMQQRHSYGKKLLCIQRRPFQRVVREISQDYADDMRWTKGALNTLQEITEREMTKLVAKAQNLASYCDRVTLYAKDMRFAACHMDQKDQNMYEGHGKEGLVPYFSISAGAKTYHRLPILCQHYVPPKNTGAVKD